ncbi:MAG: DinB family protein [Phycisphaerales bacterium]|nr:hypothetical protein [Planctomycetota bacterium]MCH8508997.1 DinB family protein [Phycisphaerales bacterium]
MPLPTDPVLAMLEHNAWANAVVIDACAALTDEQLDHEFPMGLATLRRTMTHTIAAMRLWSDRLAPREPRPWLDATPEIGPAEWRQLNREAATDLRLTAFAGPMDEVIEVRRAEQVWHYPRAHLVVHVATHGVHHRAQCVNMLRQIGVDPLPPGSALQWSLTDD